MPQRPSSPAWFVRKDLDGFFGLMIDNLIQLILIVGLCRDLIHLPDEYILARFCPVPHFPYWLATYFMPGRRAD